MAPSSSGAATTILVEVHEFNRNFAADVYPTLSSLITVRFQGLSGTSQSVKHLLLTNMRLIEYEPTEKEKRWPDSTIQRQKGLISEVKKCFNIEFGQLSQKLKPELFTE